MSRAAIYAQIAGSACAMNCSNFLQISDRDIPKSTLSLHFRALREAGLIRSERRGVEMHNTTRCADIEQRFPGLLPAILQARGHEQIAARAASAYEHWVGAEGLRFRGRDDADRLGDVVKLHWEAVAGDGTVTAVGLSILILATDGRIERDYTFVVA